MGRHLFKDSAVNGLSPSPPWLLLRVRGLASFLDFQVSELQGVVILRGSSRALLDESFSVSLNYPSSAR